MVIISFQSNWVGYYQGSVLRIVNKINKTYNISILAFLTLHGFGT